MEDYSSKTTDELKILYHRLKFAVNCSYGKNPAAKFFKEEILEGMQTLEALRKEIDSRPDRHESAVSWVLKEFNAGKYD